MRLLRPVLWMPALLLCAAVWMPMSMPRVCQAQAGAAPSEAQQIVSSPARSKEEAVAEEVLRKPIKDGVVVVRRKSVEPLLSAAEKQAELNRILPGAVYRVPDSTVELSVVKITSLGESLLWKRTFSEYSGAMATRLQMLDVLIEDDSYVVLYQHRVPAISVVYGEVITLQQPFAQVRSEKASFTTPVYSVGPFVESAILKGSFSQNNLSAEVKLMGSDIPLSFVYDGKQWTDENRPFPNFAKTLSNGDEVVLARREILYPPSPSMLRARNREILPENPKALSIYSLGISLRGERGRFSWRKTITKYDGAALTVYDVEIYEGNLFVVYNVGGFLQVEMVKPGQTSHKDAIVPENVLLRSDVGDYVEKASLIREATTGKLSIVVQENWGAKRHFFYGEGKWIEQKATSPSTR